MTEAAHAPLRRFFDPLALVLLCALIVFAVRVPARMLGGETCSDLTGTYGPTRVFLDGGNPFDRSACHDALAVAGAPRTPDGKSRFVGSLYPPSTFLLLSVVSWLPWAPAKWTCLFLNLLALVALAWTLSRIVRYEAGPARARWIPIVVLLAAPLHSGIRLGQMVPIVVALCALGLRALRPTRSHMSGLLFGVAAGLKPQLGLPFLAYLAVTGRWRGAVTGTSLFLILNALASLRLLAAGVLPTALAEHFIQNFAASGAGKVDGFTVANPWRGSLLNLHVLLNGFLTAPEVVSALVWMVMAVLGVAYLLLLRRRRPISPADELLYASVPAIASLLVVYHRAYDAALVLLPVAWALSAEGPAMRPAARWVIALATVFLVPGGALINVAQQSGKVPSWLMQHWAWQALVVPHASMALLGILCALLSALAARGADRTPPGGLCPT